MSRDVHSAFDSATGDYEFLDTQAVDILVETARLWADLGFWRDEDGGTYWAYGHVKPIEFIDEDNRWLVHTQAVTHPDDMVQVDQRGDHLRSPSPQPSRRPSRQYRDAFPPVQVQAGSPYTFRWSRRNVERMGSRAVY